MKGKETLLDLPLLKPVFRELGKKINGNFILTHGNGPQIGQLALNQLKLIDSRVPNTLDLLGAQTEGMLGYVIEQELANELDEVIPLVTILTRVEVDPDDIAFNQPTKPIGPWLRASEKQSLQLKTKWQFIEQNGRFRRVVASPKPRKIMQSLAVKKLLSSGVTVICAGGGGIPVVKNEGGEMEGVEAVIDKDFASALLAIETDASMLVLATDVKGVYSDWDGEKKHKLDKSTPEELLKLDLPSGSMAPKVQAACDFVSNTGNPAIIGSLEELPRILDRKAGTLIIPGPIKRIQKRQMI